ncbi:hypothetical protein EV126DRAFT_423544 [Verticillium dahliae]|nr:hypothetical protein EV126DRAFT_423544 [Verticillium dahliae]
MNQLISTHDTFHPFPRFPLEIRRLIWEQARSESYMFCAFDTAASSNHNMQQQAGKIVSWRQTNTILSCREARQAMLVSPSHVGLIHFAKFVRHVFNHHNHPRAQYSSEGHLFVTLDSAMIHSRSASEIYDDVLQQHPECPGGCVHLKNLVTIGSSRPIAETKNLAALKDEPIMSLDSWADVLPKNQAFLDWCFYRSHSLVTHLERGHRIKEARRIELEKASRARAHLSACFEVRWSVPEVGELYHAMEYVVKESSECVPVMYLAALAG